jgi:hypothetical protein
MKTRPNSITAVIFALFLLIWSSNSVAQNRFEAEWRQVDSLAGMGQPRSALELTDRIYAMAKKQQDDAQIIKSILYRIRLNGDFQENYLERSVKNVQAEIRLADSPRKQILYSVLAELFQKYLEANQFRIRERSQMAGFDPDSIATWDAHTLCRAVVRNYMFSLSNPEALKKAGISAYMALLEVNMAGEKTQEEELNKALRFQPTLYDFLASRALVFFTSNTTPLMIPVQRFQIDQPWFYGLTRDFIRNRMAIPSDTLAPGSFALQIFRDLATFHFQDQDRAALIVAELKRLDYVRTQGVNSDKDSLYLAALASFEKLESGAQHSTLISFARAQFLQQQGQQYQPSLSQEHKWDLKAAAAVCRAAIERYPDSDGANNCAVLMKELMKPSLNLRTEKAVPDEKPSLALVRFSNIRNLWFRLVKTDADIYQENTANMDQEALMNYLAGLPVTKKWTTELPDDGDLQEHSTELRIPEAGTGFYLLLVSSSASFTDKDAVVSWSPFWSTRISFLSRKAGDGATDYFLFDRITGQPLKNAAIEVWNKVYNYRDRRYDQQKLSELVSDESGFFRLTPERQNERNANVFLKIRMKSDLFITSTFYRSADPRMPERTIVQTTFFTDRSVYRPGQTIFFKGMVVERSGDASFIKTEYPSRIVFSDVNGRKITEKEVITNDFGTFFGSFTAPQDVLPGQMTISCETGSTSIQAEYYKLPTFDVTYEPMEGNYKLDEALTVKGKAMAFAGNAITGAQVTYRVIRTTRFPWHERFSYIPILSTPEQEIVSGTTKTDEKGQFVVSFTAYSGKSLLRNNPLVYDFNVVAEVTDLNGETQSGEQMVSVGSQSLQLGINIPEKAAMNPDAMFVITATNLQGRPTPSTVTITLERLTQPDRSLKPREWERPDLTVMSREAFHASFPYDIYGSENEPDTWKAEKTMLEKVYVTNKDSVFKLNPTLIPGLLPGVYRLKMKATDPFGQPVETKQVFTLYDPASQAVPETGFWWFVAEKTSGEPGEKARFRIGTSEEGVRILYEVTKGDSLITREWLKPGNRSMFVEIPITEQLRGNFAVNFLAVIQNRIFQESSLVKVPWSNKKLDIRFETFRDKILPGSRETWKIRITGMNGKGAPAEMLASMYDAALDVFKPHQFSFDLYQRLSGLNPWLGGHAFEVGNGQVRMPLFPSEGYNFIPSFQLNWFGFSYFNGYSRFRRGAKGGPEMMMSMDMAKPEATEKEEGAALYSLAAPVVPEENAAQQKDGQQGGKGPSVMTVRRYFRETAFFYPTMRTDSTGALSLQFTVPESLTRWKFLGMAHTKNLEYGFIEKEVVSQKSLMLFSNMPRFVRQGDTLEFSSRIANLSANSLSGEAAIMLWDAVTQKPFDQLLLSDVKQPFSIAKGLSGKVSWRIAFPVATDLSMLSVRIMASAGNFTDAEERIVPVLSNRMMVTETLPLPVRGKGTTSFTLKKLLQSGKEPRSTLKSFRLTLEFASNPAWYAIQALPGLNDYPYETADALFNAWWSNSLSNQVMQSNPRIMAVFNAWKSIVPNTLKSSLSKNESLKSAILQETPWVTEATTETEQKQKLGEWFDSDRISQTLGRQQRKLMQLQTPSGGWTWMPGMKENRYTTQAIVTGLGKLIHLGISNLGSDPEIRMATEKAIRYLDEQLVRDFQEIKKYDKDWVKNNHLSPLQVQYLYALSFFGKGKTFAVNHTDPGFTEAYEYFLAQAGKYWTTQDRYTQGMIALALSRAGRPEAPALIRKSLLEKALRSPEMGMYWAGGEGYYWYQAPIETQAMMIELFDETGNDPATVDDLKVWLLKQKQTQMWKSSRATLEACYALLMRGTSMLMQDDGAAPVTVTLGKEKIDPQELPDNTPEPGTGYFKVSWSGNEIRPEMGQISVNHSGQGVAWGALYWQYTENLDRITGAVSPLKIEKRLLRSASASAIQPLVEVGAKGAGDSLNPGDEVTVRIVLSSDRNLEFVHLRDMRAANLEPSASATLSGYRYQDGLGYYQSTTDVATDFFFDYLPKGTYVFEYKLNVNAKGSFSNGISTVQCMYAPEFSAHTQGIRITGK